MGSARARPYILLFLVRVADKANMAVFFDSGKGEHATYFFANVNFLLAFAADFLRGTHIQQKKYRLLFFLFIGFYVSTISFCGHIPVDRPYVVAILVCPY